MIPVLYESTEQVFATNGLGRLRDCISCIVTEERNGIYECDFEYPIDGANFDLIKVGRIVAVTHDDSGDVQPFDIVSYSKPIDGVVTFHCTHISYRQSFYVVKTSTVNSLSAAFALLRTAVPTNPFSYDTDKTTSGFLPCADGAPRSVREMLGGIEGSILDTYGGEYEFDKFSVYLHQARGQARNMTIRYGVNMTEFNDDTDTSENYSSCVPFWTDGESYVIGDRVTSGDSTVTGRGECVPLDVSDKFENKPTKAQVEAAGAAVLTETKPFLPVQTITVSFARLQDLGYDQFENLYECNLCDSIKVVFPSYELEGNFKIVKVTWNVLGNKYESMELGALQATLAEALGISNSLSSSTAIGNVFEDLVVNNDLTVGNDETVSGNIWADGNIEADGQMNCNGNMSTAGDFTAGGSIASTTELIAGTDVVADGDITAGGSITAGGHSSPIGTIVTPSTQPVSTSVNSSTSWNNTNSSVTLPAGTWLLIGFASFPTKSGNTRRAVRWMKGSSAIDGTNIISAPTYDALTNLQTMAVQTITASTTFRLSVLQNGGSTLSVTTYAWAVRIV